MEIEAFQKQAEDCGDTGPRWDMNHQYLCNDSCKLLKSRYIFMSPCPTFICSDFSFPCKSAQPWNYSLSRSLCLVFSFPPALILWSLSNRGSASAIIHQILIYVFWFLPSSCSLSLFISPSHSFPKFFFIFTFHLLFNFLSETKGGFQEWLCCNCHAKLQIKGLGGMRGREFRSTVWTTLIAMTTWQTYIAFLFSIPDILWCPFHLCLHQGIIHIDFICQENPSSVRNSTPHAPQPHTHTHISYTFCLSFFPSLRRWPQLHSSQSQTRWSTHPGTAQKRGEILTFPIF